MISKTKRLGAAAAAAAVALTAAACSDGGSGGAGTSMEEEDVDTITVWHTGDETQLPMIEAVGELFEAEHGVKVEVETLDWADAHAQILTAIQSQDGPDIFTGGLSWGIEFGEKGGLVDLRDYDTQNLEDNVIEGLWNSIESPGGELYGVPLNMTTYSMFYRSDILEEEGIEVPGTWDEMDAAITELQGAGYETPFAATWEPIGWLDWFNYMHEAGGSLYNEDCTEVLVDSPEVVAGTEYWAKRFTDQNVPTDQPDLGAGMDKGEYVFATGGSWNYDVLAAGFPELEGKWSSAPLPAGPANAGSFIGGNVMGVMLDSEAPGTSAAFIDMVYSDEGVAASLAAAEAEDTLWLPPRTDKVADTHLSEDNKAALTEIFETSVGPPNCAGWEEASPNVQRALQTIALDGASVEEGLAEAKAEMEATLK
ncbi:extracellular solute-binding protein [Glycomyces buryatensis]|uniref:Extracellular solute-binding protein n=1 Tax=Glycomyces buryatensis TaxID=2570927 RepID=A0A4S8QQF0_9ACTN|nr:extracellular solute-binding protein [Glycomyces buryatensis]THV42944.1 extracellular solute-binding protein [Glycomyces buryatensis]